MQNKLDMNACVVLARTACTGSTWPSWMAAGVLAHQRSKRQSARSHPPLLCSLHFSPEISRFSLARTLPAGQDALLKLDIISTRFRETEQRCLPPRYPAYARRSWVRLPFRIPHNDLYKILTRYIANAKIMLRNPEANAAGAATASASAGLQPASSQSTLLSAAGGYYGNMVSSTHLSCPSYLIH